VLLVNAKLEKKDAGRLKGDTELRPNTFPGVGDLFKRDVTDKDVRFGSKLPSNPS